MMFLRSFSGIGSFDGLIVNFESLTFISISLLVILIYIVKHGKGYQITNSEMQCFEPMHYLNKDILMQDRPLGPSGELLNNELFLRNINVPKVILWFWYFSILLSILAAGLYVLIVLLR